ncbi:hypothetical protein DFQ29_007294 [Apophysomyces sp. BC1021]|nr:hypothetical protein DFQ29_007294 [Apophysomyces sp. BC1021]
MIYYSLTFFLLVTEMVVFGILILPLPSHWRRAMLKFISTSPVILDTINRLQRIESEAEEEQAHHHDYSYEANLKAKRFYAQRNLYLIGFTLFLSLILERTSTLVIEVLKREEEVEQFKKENVSAAKDQQRLINMEQSYKKEIDELTQKVNDLKKQGRDYEILKKQAAQQHLEYNRLADERNALERAANSQSVEEKKGI